MAKFFRRLRSSKKQETLGINSQHTHEANLQIGPTDRGNVRLYVSSNDGEISMDFDPEQAEEIAEEIKAAAELARKRAPKTK